MKQRLCELGVVLALVPALGLACLLELFSEDSGMSAHK